MKYEKEITQFFKDCFCDSLTTKKEVDDIIHEMRESGEINYYELSGILESGIKSGYSLDEMFTMIKSNSQSKLRNVRLN